MYVSESSMRLKCYALYPNPPRLVPARPERAWMEAFPARHAYRCLPLTIANSHGWEILSLEADHELHAQYLAWRDKREEFMAKFRAGDQETFKQAWQRYYFKGEYPAAGEQEVQGHR